MVYFGEVFPASSNSLIDLFDCCKLILSAFIILAFSLTAPILLNVHSVALDLTLRVSKINLFFSFECRWIVCVISVDITSRMTFNPPLTGIASVVTAIEHIVKRVTYLIAMPLLIR